MDDYDNDDNEEMHEIFEEARDLIVFHHRRVAHQVAVRRYLRENLNPFDMSVTEFSKLFRMSQPKMRRLIEILRPYVRERVNANQVSFEQKVLTAVCFYACGNYQRVLGRMSDLNVCQGSVSNIITEITQAFNNPEVLARFIHFPTTNEEREDVIRRNNRLGMPRTLGFIDGTLVSIVPPPKNERRRAYFCRKGFAAINVQIVCDADLRILNVDARYPGTCNDAYIFLVSLLRPEMKRAYERSRCWLLGDSGYAHEPWLQLPLPHAARGTPEYSYTRLHCHCRNAVERCIGVLKGRWRCLTRERVLHYSPGKAGLITNACCVLHNFCREENIPDPPPFHDMLPRREGEEDPEENEYVGDLYPDGPNLGVLADEQRQFLVEYAHNLRRGDQL